MHMEENKNGILKLILLVLGIDLISLAASIINNL